ncbi:MAG: hypothetical protein HYX96_01480 [Chloroflexi bacterium]|nr:hypothetical protein [Chloroflexota bacterium]
MFRAAFFTFAALVVGLFGLSLLFADLGPGESFTGRIVMLVITLLLSGLVIGFFNPGAWFLAGLTAWGSVLIGAAGIVAGDNRVESFGMLLLPLGLALVSGYAGALLSKSQAFRKLPRLFRRDRRSSS